MKLTELLRGWLPEQRWFAGKGREIDDVTIESDTELRSGDPGLRHLILRVAQGDTADRYQVLLGVREQLPDRLKHAEIGWCADGAGCAYDAAHDAALTGVLLDALADDAHVGGLSFHRLPGVRVRTGLRSLVIGAEQSNTSLVFGESYVCKLFRRLAPGLNPDLDLTRALVGAGSVHVPRMYGWAQAEMGGEPTTLAVFSRYLRSGTDGWTLAATSVRDLYATDGLPAGDAGGDFAPEAGRLGRATAEVHRDLAHTLGTWQWDADQVADLADGMRARLSEAVAEVPELAPHVGTLREAFDALAGRRGGLTVQRVHGDYHLGQVLRTDLGWVLLDFEGEPARPLAERRAPASPLRDVAGMLRSLEYAAGHQLVGHPDESHLAGRARDWAQRNRAAFCAGYAEAGGLDPDTERVAMRAFEFDKAVYEVMYEAHHRPAWLPIPLRSIARLTR